MEKYIRYSLCLLWVICVVSCTGKPVSMPTAAIPSIPNPTIIPTITTVRPTPEILLLPTPTSLPRLAENNAREVLTSLFGENGDCALPCVLGLTPGKSDLLSTRAFMQYFENTVFRKNGVNIQSDVDKDLMLINLLLFENSKRTQIIFDASGNDRLDKTTLHAESMNIDTSLLDFEDRYGIELMKYYSLPSVLATYGVPSEIIIAPFPTDPNYPSDPYPFSLVLYYQKQGFLVQYVSLRQDEGENYLGCQPTSYIDVVTWSPDKNISLDSAISNLSGIGINSLNRDYFRKLPDVTSLTSETFYEQFKMPGKNCIVTPKNAWGGQ